MVLKSNLKDLKKKIKELEKADEDNQLTLNFVWNEIGCKDLDNLKELLAGQKLSEILTELHDRTQEVKNSNNELITKEEEMFKLDSQLQCLVEKVNELGETNNENINSIKKKIKEQENEIKAKQETIRYLEEMSKEREKEVIIMQELIIEFGDNVKEQEEKLKVKQKIIDDYNEGDLKLIQIQEEQEFVNKEKFLYQLGI
ncbi:9921_t:CDS:2 [Funneliformis geosporum]|uniref:9921_t:CDS:1 n=1 Tax=Funneliformis geosporum TaxID=1117311 RepID=A0A9W4WTL9_9GLOM|nr:9921_t:CDS:2 [Funneliformis geosporum]